MGVATDLPATLTAVASLSPSPSAAAPRPLLGETPELELDSVEGIASFKYAVTLAVLVITVVSALAPLWISRNGTSHSRQLLTKKLPFVTAGVFIGSGLLHLLPDSVKMYNKVLLAEPAVYSAKWIHDFPAMYLLSAVGCMVVWAVDLLNMGDSPKMMAVASAARPDHQTSIFRVQIPRVASYGARNRSVSVDGHGSHRFDACSCTIIASPASTAFHRATTSEATTLVLVENGVKVVGESSTRTYSFDYPCASETTGLVKDDARYSQPEATVRAHVVFSGQSPYLPYLLAALFSVHSLIAGFALGVNSSSNKTAIATAIAIFSHKIIEAMSVGANFARAKNDIGQDRSVAVLTLYSLMTPMGILLGMLLADTLEGTAVLVVESIALSVASGSFVYLAFHELAEEHAGKEAASLEKILLFGAGLFSMAALATWT